MSGQPTLTILLRMCLLWEFGSYKESHIVMGLSQVVALGRLLSAALVAVALISTPIFAQEGGTVLVTAHLRSGAASRSLAQCSLWAGVAGSRAPLDVAVPRRRPLRKRP